MKLLRNIFIYTLFTAISILSAKAQIVRPEAYAAAINSAKLFKYASFIADTINQGREAGTAGGQMAGDLIMHFMEHFKVQPLPERHTLVQPFRIDSSRMGRNICGCIRGMVFPDEYVIVTAPYDHLGKINGVVYPGADKSAAGVAMLMNLIETFSCMEMTGKGPRRSVIFVAYDASGFSCAGAKYFAEHLNIPVKKIVANINLDQVGSNYAPPGREANYVLALCGGDGKRNSKFGGSFSGGLFGSIMNSVNKQYKLNLFIDYTFYNSPTFFDIFFKTSDQAALYKKGVPSLLLTAGINNYTLKPNDTCEILNLSVMEARCRLVFYTLFELSMRSE